MNLTISDFNITGEPIPEKVADKILKNFIRPLETFMECTEIQISISHKSGYRPLSHEHSRGRKGNSQHVFKGHGAADITFINFDQQLDEVLEGLVKFTGFTRIAVYKESKFIHVDYAIQDERWLFNSKWERLKRLG